MTFIEAALSLLQKSRRALTAEQLAERADKAELLGKPGKDPVRSMKAALTREIKKGDESRVESADGESWKLSSVGKAAAKGEGSTSSKSDASSSKKTRTKKTAAKKSAAQTSSKKTSKKTSKKPSKKSETASEAAPDTTTDATEAEATTAEATSAAEQGVEGAGVKKPRGSRRRRKKKPAADPSAGTVETAGSEAEPPAEEVATRTEAETGETGEAQVDAVPEAGDVPGKKRRRRGKRKRRGRKDDQSTDQAAENTADENTADESVASAPAEPVTVEQLSDVLAPKEMPVRADTPVTPDDEDLQALYSDELSGTEPGAAYAEYEDSQTADEDRPMSPEIVSTRPERQRRERKKRRERQRSDERRDSRSSVSVSRPEAKERAPSRPPREAPTRDARDLAESDAEDWYISPGNPLAAQAVDVLSAAERQSLRGKQLARIMSDQELIAGAPESVWPHLESALLHDERIRVSRGLRPRVVYRGRGTFHAPGAIGDSDLAAAEDALENAAQSAAAATHRALANRLAAMDMSDLERVAHVFLLAQGFDDIEWIKRSQRSSYALASAPAGLGDVLVGVRAGDQPVDRGGVGELRVGVQAKKLASGVLLAPRELSDAARHELRRNGPSLAIMVGHTFVSALVRAGIGVTHAQISVPLLDESFLGGTDD